MGAWFVCLFALAVSAAGERPAPVWAVLGSRVFDGDGIQRGWTVVFGPEGIRAAGPSARVAIPEGARRVSGVGRTLLPALCDLHVHVFGAPGGPQSALRRSAERGVLFLLDLNAPEPTVFEWGERSRQLVFDGARLFAAGAAFTAAGGHAAEGGFPAHEVTPGGLDALLRRLAPRAGRRAAIKAVLDPGGHFGTARAPSLSGAEIGRLAREAERLGVPLVVHVVDPESALAAIAAGADALAHLPLFGPGLERVVKACLERRVYVLPTLAAWRVASRAGPRASAREVARALPRAAPALARLARSSLLLCGSDAGIEGVAFGEGTVRELLEWSALGLEPEVCLAAATVGPRRFLGLGERPPFAPGSPADLLLVEGDPTVDLGALSRVAAVWRAGRRIDPRTRQAEETRSRFVRDLLARLGGAEARPLGGPSTSARVRAPPADGTAWAIEVQPGPRTSPDRPAGVRFLFAPPVPAVGAEGLVLDVRASRRAVLRVRWVERGEAGVDPLGWDLGVTSRTRSATLTLDQARRRGFAGGSRRADPRALAALDFVVEDDDPPLTIRIERLSLYGSVAGRAEDGTSR